MQRLGIAIIRAYSPQAKGRVERKHGVFQDRFAKDLKLYGISTIDAANRYLEEKFLNKINEKFAYAPKDSKDGHRDPKPYGDLKEILCWRYKRQLKNDWSIVLNREYFQVKKPEELAKSNLQPGELITIRKYLDGSMGLSHKELKLDYYELQRKPTAPSKSKKYYQAKGGVDVALLSKNAKKNKHKSPWNNYSDWLLANRNDIQNKREELVT